MSKKAVSIIGMALGALIAVAALLMGYFGFPHAGFGWRKIIPGDLGLLLLIASTVLFFWKIKSLKDIWNSSKYSWITLFGFTFCAVYLYIISEWIFTVTKPSFLSLVAFPRKLGILFTSGALFAGLAFLGLTFFYLLSLIPWFKRSPKIFLSLASLIPVTVTAVWILMLFDNFTFTVFQFGIVTSVGVFRLLYLMAFFFLFIFLYIKMQSILSDLNSLVVDRRNRKIIVPVLVGFMVISFLITYRGNSGAIGNLDITKQSAQNQYPNIILITGDGINASHTSVYGYERDTTPNLKALASTSLVAENAFPNSSNTMSALLSIYTSKYPTQTRVLYPPDILKNADAYQHLPGILKSLGYYTAQYTNAYYADAYDMNMLSAFDYANGRSIEQGSFYDLISKAFTADYSYFIYNTFNRITDRLQHISFIKQMVNQQALVAGTARTFKDQEKVDDILNVLSNAKQPVFIDLHWMGTHGPTFDPKKQVFSAGMNVNDQGQWNNAFYDDSILAFDAGVGQIIDFLKSNGLYDNTIIIVSSDHDQQWSATSRIPLLIHFPNGQYSGVRNSDLQQIDIAPTLLAYLGIQKPSWMEGDSFLSGELGNRPIFSVSMGKVEIEDELMVVDALKPPYYQFGDVSVVYCNSWFTLQLDTNQYQTGLVSGHTQPCSPDVVSRGQFISWIIGHLKATGFDTSQIENAFGK